MTTRVRQSLVANVAARDSETVHLFRHTLHARPLTQNMCLYWNVYSKRQHFDIKRNFRPPVLSVFLHDLYILLALCLHSGARE